MKYIYSILVILVVSILSLSFFLDSSANESEKELPLVSIDETISLFVQNMNEGKCEEARNLCVGNAENNIDHLIAIGCKTRFGEIWSSGLIYTDSLTGYCSKSVETDKEKEGIPNNVLTFLMKNINGEWKIADYIYHLSPYNENYVIQDGSLLEVGRSFFQNIADGDCESSMSLCSGTAKIDLEKMIASECNLNIGEVSLVSPAYKDSLTGMCMFSVSDKDSEPSEEIFGSSDDKIFIVWAKKNDEHWYVDDFFSTTLWNTDSHEDTACEGGECESAECESAECESAECDSGECDGGEF